MNNTIFDVLEDEIPEDKKGYFKIAEKAPEPKDDEFLENVKDYGKSILKGSIEGISRLGKMMGPIPSYTKTSSQELQEQTENLNKLIPTDEGFTQKALRKGIGEAPSMMAFPGTALQTLPRSLAAGFLGEGAKELGLPEWAQTAAELTAYIGPDVTKKLLEKGNNGQIIKAAKELGLSDEAITPLIQSEFKQKWLSKLAPRRGEIKESLAKSKSELHQAYDTLQKSTEATKPLSQESTKSLMKGFYDKLIKMPSGVRNKIKEDFKDLTSSPINGEKLMNFYADINHYLGENAKQLSLLKEPIKKALNEISPKLGKDFNLVNDLYSKYHTISAKLKPTLLTDLIGASEAIGTLFSLATGNYPYIFKIAGEKTGREIAKNLLINPRFQQISEKIVESLKQNKYGTVKKFSEEMQKMIGKISPEIAEKLENISEDELKEIIKQNSEDRKSKNMQ
jgi:hypothetical protein